MRRWPGCSGTRRRAPWSRTSPASGSRPGTSSSPAPTRSSSPPSTSPSAGRWQREVDLFFAAVLRDNRPITDFLHADYTFLNERLAKHYGIAGLSGEGFRRVQLTDRNRGGVVTMASTLTVTSNPTRTSPVKRGKWILEEILGTPPPPPPPGSPTSRTTRRGPSRSRSAPGSNSTGATRIAPRATPGWTRSASAWKTSTPSGRTATRDGDQPIDSQGVLPGGPSFHGPVELKAVLLAKQVPFSRCFAEKLMTYALGRGLEANDRCAVEGIAARAMLGGGQVGRFVAEIVHSPMPSGRPTPAPGGPPR